MTFTPPDIIIFLILLFFAFNGFRHGFIEEMARLISLIGGFIFASKFHHLLIPYTKNYIESNAIQITISYMAVFIISAIIITLIAKVLQKFIELVLLGWLNRLLGLLLGLLKGFLIISLFIFIIQTLPLQLDETDLLQKKLEDESVMYQICENVKELVILTMPIENKLDVFEKIIYEDLKEENIQKLLDK